MPGHLITCTLPTSTKWISSYRCFVTLAYWIEPSLLKNEHSKQHGRNKVIRFFSFYWSTASFQKIKRAVKFDLHYFFLRRWNGMQIRCIDRNKYIILEQNKKEIWDRKTLNGCLQSVWLVLGPNMWCLGTFTGSRCQVFVNRFWSHNS